MYIFEGCPLKVPSFKKNTLINFQWFWTNVCKYMHTAHTSPYTHKCRYCTHAMNFHYYREDILYSLLCRVTSWNIFRCCADACVCVCDFKWRENTAECVLSQITQRCVKPQLCGTPLYPRATGFQFVVAAEPPSLSLSSPSFCLPLSLSHTLPLFFSVSKDSYIHTQQLAESSREVWRLRLTVKCSQK